MTMTRTSGSITNYGGVIFSNMTIMLQEIIYFRFLYILLPSIEDRNNAFIAFSCNAKESRHGHIEVMVRGVTPPSTVVWRAKVGGSYSHTAASEAPFWVYPVITNYLIASTTNLTTSEEHCAHCCSIDPKPSMEGIIIATSSP